MSNKIIKIMYDITAKHTENITKSGFDINFAKEVFTHTAPVAAKAPPKRGAPIENAGEGFVDVVT